MKTKNRHESIYFVNCGITDSVEFSIPYLSQYFWIQHRTIYILSTSSTKNCIWWSVLKNSRSSYAACVSWSLFLLCLKAGFLVVWTYSLSKSTVHQGKGRKHPFWFMAHSFLGFELIIQSPLVAFTWYWKQFSAGISLGDTEILNVLVCFYLLSSPEFTQFLRALHSSAVVAVNRY